MVEWTTLITITESRDNSYSALPTKDGQLGKLLEITSAGQQSTRQSDDVETDVGTDSESNGSQPKRRRVQHSSGLLERIWYSMTGYVMTKNKEVDAKSDNEIVRKEK